MDILNRGMQDFILEGLESIASESIPAKIKGQLTDEQRVNELVEAEEEILAIWDESVLEKAESLKLEGLCAVRSSKASRLKRIKLGFFNPPSGRLIFVPGLNRLGILIMGCSGPPTLAAMHWWSSRG
jgi:hypothetical protein